MRTLAALLIAACMALPAAAADEDEIRAVILDQLDAFQQQDLPRAFDHASPTIQGIFGSPTRFGRMVETGYPMVWNPTRFEVGPLGEREGRLIQTMIFEDAAGQMFEADYEMRQVDGVWRINGVTIRLMPGLSS